jgi:hypothetical protein
MNLDISKLKDDFALGLKRKKSSKYNPKFNQTDVRREQTVPISPATLLESNTQGNTLNSNLQKS